MKTKEAIITNTILESTQSKTKEAIVTTTYTSSTKSTQSKTKELLSLTPILIILNSTLEGSTNRRQQKTRRQRKSKWTQNGHKMDTKWTLNGHDLSLFSFVFFVDRLNRDSSINRILAIADNGIIGRPAFMAACAHLPTSSIVYPQYLWQGRGEPKRMPLGEKTGGAVKRHRKLFCGL